MSLPQVSAVNIAVDLEKDKFDRRLANTFCWTGVQSGGDVFAGWQCGVGQNAQVSGAGDQTSECDVGRAGNDASDGIAGDVLVVAAANMNRGQRDLKLFETGKRYLSGAERWTLSILVSGRREPDWRSLKRIPLDFLM